MKKGGYVYILTNAHNTTLYVGVTSNLAKRTLQHKTGTNEKSYSFRYQLKKLVYYHWFDTILEAIAEEKRIKGGSRKKKEDLINCMNPGWIDLYDQVAG